MIFIDSASGQQWDIWHGAMSETNMMLVLTVALLHNVQFSLQAWIHHGELNLARNQVASQSSTYGGFNASLAVNGDGRDYAQTADGSSSWWKVDLSKIQFITSVVVHSTDVNPLVLELLSSDAMYPGHPCLDCEKWNMTAYQQHTTSHPWKTILVLQRVLARHIAFFKQADVGLKLFEIEIYGANANLALRKFTNQSGQVDSTTHPSHLAVNGYYMDHSRTQPVVPVWWQVDMASRYKVAMIRLHPGIATNVSNDSPVLNGVYILTSSNEIQGDFSNGSLWTTVTNNTGVHVYGKAIEFNSPAIIRSIAVTLRNNASITISELEVLAPFNLAQVGLAYQSDVAESNVSLSQNVINGIYDDSIRVGNQGAKWWRVNLVDVYVISKVRVYGDPAEAPTYQLVAVMYSKNRTFTYLPDGFTGWRNLTLLRTYGRVSAAYGQVPPVEAQHVIVMNITGSLTLSEVVLTEHNYALSQQTFSDGSSASLAVDGNLNTYSTTSTAGGQWWMVDIGQFIYFTTAFIYVRKGVCTDTDGTLQDCSQRLSDVQILTKELSSDEDGSFGKDKGWKLCFQYGGSKGDSFWIQCYQQHWLRQLAITANGTAMELREVEVYGKAMPQLDKLQWTVSKLDTETVVFSFTKWSFINIGYQPPDRYKIELKTAGERRLTDHDEFSSDIIGTQWSNRPGEILQFEISCEVRGQACDGPAYNISWYFPQDVYTAEFPELSRGQKVNFTCTYYINSKKELKVQEFGLRRRGENNSVEDLKFCGKLRGDLQSFIALSKRVRLKRGNCKESAKFIEIGQVGIVKFDKFVLNKTGNYSCSAWLADIHRNEYIVENAPVLQVKELREVTCSAPPSGRNTLPVDPSEQFEIYESFTHKCKVGYSSGGNLATYRCLANGSWNTQEIPTCYKRCPNPPVGVYTEEANLDVQIEINQRYTYSCLQGYATSDELTVTCTKNGSWVPSPPVCHIVKCPRPPDGVNTEAVVYPELREYKQQYNYSCREGFVSNDNLTITCAANGTWSSPAPTCGEPTCSLPNPGVNTNQVIIPGAIDYGQEYTYTCLPGYATSATGLTVSCEESGEWSAPPPTCKPVKCENPPAGNNVKVVNLVTPKEYKQTYTYACRQGYTTTDNVTITCTADGTWSRAPPRCTKIRCPPPANGENTVQEKLTANFTYKQTYTYKCIKGYASNISLIVTCEADGKWSSSPPICAISCLPPPNGEKTVQEDFMTNFTYKQTYTYRCIKGYTSDISLTVTCKADGKWSSPPPICESDYSLKIVIILLAILLAVLTIALLCVLWKRRKRLLLIRRRRQEQRERSLRSYKQNIDTYIQQMTVVVDSARRQLPAMPEDERKHSINTYFNPSVNTKNAYTTFQPLAIGNELGLQAYQVHKDDEKLTIASSRQHLGTQAGKRVETNDAYTRAANLTIPIKATAELFTEPAFADVESNKHRMNTGALHANIQKADYTTAEGTYYYGSEVEPVKDTRDTYTQLHNRAKNYRYRLTSKEKLLKATDSNLKDDQTGEESSKHSPHVRSAAYRNYEKFNDQRVATQSELYTKIVPSEEMRNGDEKLADQSVKMLKADVEPEKQETDAKY